MITQEEIDRIKKEIYSKINRFEVIDHTTKAKEKGTQGRAYTNYNCSIELSLQDNNNTLKVFVNDR